MIRLPGPAKELRIDPFGRLLLARPDTGDSVWVINVGTNRVVATLPTAWRADLPNVGPDGAVATIAGRDVHFTIPGHAKPRIIVRDGANEIWHFVFWNGFRPRAPGLDQPVVFAVDTAYYVAPEQRLARHPGPGAGRLAGDAAAGGSRGHDDPRARRSRVWSVQVAAVFPRIAPGKLPAQFASTERRLVL